MIDLGLSPSELETFEETLLSSHKTDHLVTIHDRNEKRIDTLPIVAGAIQVDGSQAVSRSLTLTAIDLRGALRFEDSPRHGALYADHFVSVRYGVKVDEWDEYVYVPIFWGPVTGFAQTGSNIEIEAQGKEALLMKPHFAKDNYVLQKGQRLDDAIREVARKQGERRFDLPDISARLTDRRVVEPDTEPWRLITSRSKIEKKTHEAREEDKKKGDVAGKGDVVTGTQVGGLVNYGPHEWDVFYGGDGRLTMRRSNKNATWTVKDDQLLSHPSLSYDDLEVINHVVVTGAKPKGKAKGETAARGQVALPRQHPLSPWKLARNGEPRFKTRWVKAASLKTDRECQQRAREILDKNSKQVLEAEFESLPIPHLEEGDRIKVKGAQDFEFTLKAFTIPLTPGESMSFGFTKKAGRPKRRRRIKGRPGGYSR